jgi:hypothetical protein
MQTTMNPDILERLKVFINRLTADETVQILDICKEKLGLVSHEEFKQAVGWDKSRQALHNKIKAGKLKTYKIGNTNYIIINDN